VGIRNDRPDGVEWLSLLLFYSGSSGKINEVEGKEQYRVEIPNGFSALENAEVDINRAWKIIRENIKISVKDRIGYYELKKHKS
jgi:uncharacterized protein YwgA